MYVTFFWGLSHPGSYIGERIIFNVRIISKSQAEYELHEQLSLIEVNINL